MIEEANSPMDFHDSLNGAMIALALFITNSSVAASDDMGADPGWSSIYNRVIFFSRGIHKIEPSVSDDITALLQRSGKSVSITPETS
tara:strand:+ start:1496 stop:1756 length:261 start_codon:yes stop_codon:yes gene_type:complete